MLEADVAIIGGGPGGYVCGIRSAQLGLRTVVIEADKLGGECLNYGCIPSKSLITVSKLVDKVKEAESFGLKATGVSVDFVQLQKWKSEIVSKLVGGVEGLLRGYHATVVFGMATVVSKDRLEVATSQGKEEISFKKLVIATGTRTSALPGLEFDGDLVISSKEGLELMGAPNQLVIVGGGAIGLEFASMFQKLGSRVSIIEIMDQLLPGTDPEIVRVVQRKLEARGAKVHLKSKVIHIVKKGSEAEVEVETPGGRATITADKVLVSVGRKPRTENLNLAALGVRTDPRGYVITNERMETNVPGIFAIGDVRGPPLLAHKASKEGIVAAECIAGLPSAADWKVVPDAVFCDPEVASAGLSEAKAIEGGYKVKRSRFQFAALGRALSAGEPEGFVKVVANEDGGLVLGVQIVGPEASNLISEVALAIEMGATVEDIAMTIHPHPTLPEAIMEASESAAGHPVHQLRT
ncbi:MAG: dihydrolipoyl dehydrogenase [Nitrososphaerota archaeon]|jgi:dihydrolipoamide dehydrogenase|nr:dihydrolipoyl dehydrogenase [Nitrososphaerota archaeon]MDG6917243.1 dihydrolipoyl dehydrogenase [Nitrososphaerota archaeon]MDG6918059.1 dihydrolipoyl dehydrogenase [Nitrososphaerota archaeon]MDG6949768.1 dihydrolipoyl dehydrogenase [Nitrososphaerota archaeon]